MCCELPSTKISFCESYRCVEDEEKVEINEEEVRLDFIDYMLNYLFDNLSMKTNH